MGLQIRDPDPGSERQRLVGHRHGAGIKAFAAGRFAAVELIPIPGDLAG